MFAQLINALTEFLGLLAVDLPTARHGGDRSTQVRQRTLNCSHGLNGVVIVSDADGLGAAHGLA
jgi:hypothetical protein